jgi:hypothetical protein
MYGSIGKILILLGVLLIVVGAIFLVLSKAGLLGRLPGDIHIRRENFEFHFPLAACIVASIIMSLLLGAFFRWFKK